MIIMPNLKLVFIHIYKTGGTSLTRLLSAHSVPEFRAKQPRHNGPGFQGTWHYRGAQHSMFLSENAGFPDDLKPELASYRFLAVVRNPYTWSHSVFQDFMAEDKGGDRGPNFLFGQVSPQRRLRDFLKFVEAFRPGYGGQIGLATQSAFLKGIPRDQLRLIRFENYEKDVRRILPSLGVTVGCLPHALNRGDDKRRTASALMNDPAHVAACNRVYVEDFANFGYDMIAPLKLQA